MCDKMTETEQKSSHLVNKVINPSDGNGTKCLFYLQKKKRFCKMEARAGTDYCIIHAHEMGVTQNGRKRIPCPHDPKHSCYENQLQKHLKKCNARPELNPFSDKHFLNFYQPCYVHNINCGSDDEADPASYKVGIRDVSDDEVLELAKTVRKLHKEFIGKLDDCYLFHEVMQQEADKPSNGPSAQKHIKQQASLIGHLRKAGLLRNGISYLEFGAGKGGLSHWVQLALSECANNQYILIDRSSVRYKMDTYHKGADQGPNFQRIKTDIKHLYLGKISSLQDDVQPVVGVGKHLCGSATDLMLRCLMDTCQKDETGAKVEVLGLVLALCCHHRCDWQTYCGKAFFRRCGLSARDFHLVSSMTSWATCASRPEPEHSGDGSNITYNHHRYGKLLPQEREIIGYQCKQLIDRGRVHYLQDHGYSVQQLCYVEREQTLENMALVAKWQDIKT